MELAFSIPDRGIGTKAANIRIQFQTQSELNDGLISMALGCF